MMPISTFNLRPPWPRRGDTATRRRGELTFCSNSGTPVPFVAMVRMMGGLFPSCARLSMLWISLSVRSAPGWSDLLITKTSAISMMPALMACTSSPQFVKDHPGLRIALLNLDVDLYAPTKVALETLYPLVLKGGIVVFDEYGWEQWPGESRAVDEYFGALGEQPAIHRFPFSPTPGGYMVKR